MQGKVRKRGHKNKFMLLSGYGWQTQQSLSHALNQNNSPYLFYIHTTHITIELALFFCIIQKTEDGFLHSIQQNSAST